MEAVIKGLVRKVMNEEIKKGAHLGLNHYVDEGKYNENVAFAYLTDGTRKVFCQSNFYSPEDTPNGGLLNSFDNKYKEDLYTWIEKNAEAIILLGDYCSEFSFYDWKKTVEAVTRARGGNHLKWTHGSSYLYDSGFWSI